MQEVQERAFLSWDGLKLSLMRRYLSGDPTGVRYVHLLCFSLDG